MIRYKVRQSRHNTKGMKEKVQFKGKYDNKWDFNGVMGLIDL